MVKNASTCEAEKNTHPVDYKWAGVAELLWFGTAWSCHHGPCVFVHTLQVQVDNVG